MNDKQMLANIRRILKDPFREYPGLDDREKKALADVAEGKISRELAVDLDVSIRTAYNVVDRALVKISRTEGYMVRRDDLTGLVFAHLRHALNARKGRTTRKKAK